MSSVDIKEKIAPSKVAGEQLPDVAMSQDSAVGQAAELGAAVGGQGSAASQQANELNLSPEAKKKKDEEKRVAAAKKDWESVLGEKLGGKAFDAIRKFSNYDSLKDQADKIVGKLSDSVGGLVKSGENISDDQAEKLNAMLSAELGPLLEKYAQKWLDSESGQNVLRAAGNWAEESPRTLVALAGAAAIGAAVYAYMSNMDPKKFAKTFKLGDKFEIGAGVDIGPLQKLSLQAVDVSIKYNSDNFNAQVGVSYTEDKGVTATASASGKGKIGGFDTTGKIAGTWSEKDGTSATASGTAKGKLGDFDASATLGGKLGKDGTSASAGLKLSGNVGKVKTDTTADVSFGTDGELKLKLGTDFSGTSGETPYSGGLGLSGKPDELKIDGKFAFGASGEEQSVTGRYDPATKAYSFGFEKTALDGRFKSKSTFGQDASGDTTRGNDVSWQDDGINVNAGQQVSGAGVTNTFGMSTSKLGVDGLSAGGKYSSGPNGDSGGFNIDYESKKLNAALDLSMSDSVKTLGFRSSGQIGDELSVGLNGQYDLNNGRLSEFGAKLGWQDTDAFKSFTLDYKAKWLSDNPGYEHGFDAAFEYSAGNLAGRFKANATLRDSGLQTAGVDATARYKLNDKWSALGGVNYQRDFQTNESSTKIGFGAQYKKSIGGMIEIDAKTKSVGFKFVIPF